MATDQEKLDRQLSAAGYDSTVEVPPVPGLIDGPVTLDDGEDPEEGQVIEGVLLYPDQHPGYEGWDGGSSPRSPMRSFERLLAEGYDARQSKAVSDLLEVVNQRGSQYGTPTDDKANLRGALLFNIDPIIGALLRANDKWVRLQNLTRERNPDGSIIIKSEAHYLQIRDQMLDIAGYQIKAMEMLDERMEEPA
jgi:hypothetical protein